MKIGVIGPRDNIMCYMSAGFSVYYAEDDEEAKSSLKEAAGDDCAIIFIAPAFCESLHDEIEKYSQLPVPAVLPLPEKSGGVGTRQMKNAVERAVGADIIFNDNEKK